MTAACRPSCRCFKCWRYPEAGSGVHGWAALAHMVQNPIEAAYARSDPFERRRRLMDEWAAYRRGPRGQAWGVGALIQRGGRAVAGMLTIATAGGS